ncbi:putative tricarboxylic transport membrane protein [Microlunatus soli]|uniref:Putative tricarboxylic transport membrane protein n=2 Tax=Microlunatus soli TaxID=630515 RepID=A0A1H1WA06_9ACTN|nr:putative tricarboxylic transport membrane protein [Microlunatus soli]
MIGALLVGACGTTSSVTAGSKGSAAGEKIDNLKIIVPAEPGGGWDQTGRAMQRAVDTAALAGNTQVQNIGGSGGTVGLAKLAQEKEPDTLMVTGLVMVGAIETNKSETTLADTTPIARLTEEPLVVVVPAESPYKTIDDLIEAVQQKGRGVSITGGSAGGADHILAGMMLKDAGVGADKLNYIPYSGGGESLAALLGNKVDAGISGVAEYADQVKAGKLRALAVSGAAASPELPKIKTLSDQGVDVTLTNWRGVIAPGDIDQQKAAQLTRLVDDMHGSGGWKKALKTNSWEDAYLSGKEFSGYLAAETTSVQGTLRDIGLTK